MSYLLDTCVLSELVKAHPAKGVVHWMEARDEHTLYLSALTIGELEKGIRKLAEGKKKELLEMWLQNDLLNRFNGRILPIDEGVARVWGTLQADAEKKGRPLPVLDGLIAATAKTHRFTVVTRNHVDMEAAGVLVLNPWS